VVLHVALQDGFEGDSVLLRLNGHGVFREDQVSTRHQLGLARNVELAVEGDSPVELEVVLPNRGLTRTITVEPSRTPNVAISVRGGELTDTRSQSRFHYM
jgi:hypothetical protein